MFDLIREHNLFTDVQDQALLLVEFDQELEKKWREETEALKPKDGEDKGREVGKEWERKKVKPSPAIVLLVDHTFSIPVRSFI